MFECFDDCVTNSDCHAAKNGKSVAQASNILDADFVIGVLGICKPSKDQGAE
jgi:hypothetical protein